MLAQLLARFRPRPSAARPRSLRRASLAVECLEARDVPAITFTPSTLTAATVGVTYTQALTGHGGTAPYKSFSISAGALPAGITLSATGTISGSATAAGTFNFTVKASDSATTAMTGTQPFTLVVHLALSPSTLPAAQAAVAYSQTITATGSTTAYHFSISGGHLPNGLKLNPTTGALSGVPLASGTFHFTVRVTDSSHGTGGPSNGSEAYALTVHPTLVTFLSSLPDVELNGTLPTFQIEVQDVQHNPLKGVTVSVALDTIASVSAAAFGSGKLTAVTGANGIATFTGLSITARGLYEIEAGAAGTVAFSNEFSVALNGRHSPA